MKKLLVAMLVVGFAAVAASAQSVSAEHIANVQTDKVMRKIEAKANAEKQLAAKRKQALENVEKAHNDLIVAGQWESSLENVIQNMYLRLDDLKKALKDLSAVNASDGAMASALVYHKYYVKVENKNYTIADIQSKAHELFPNLPYTADELK